MEKINLDDVKRLYPEAFLSAVEITRWDVQGATGEWISKKEVFRVLLECGDRFALREGKLLWLHDDGEAEQWNEENNKYVYTKV